MQMIIVLTVVSLAQLPQVSLPAKHKLSDRPTSVLEYVLSVRIPKKDLDQSVTSLNLRES